MSKEKVVIWVNHWFSTMYRLIEDARVSFAENTDKYEPYFIGTNKLDTCVYKDVCDEFYTEPADLNGDDYVNWCLDFCKKQGVDIFVPRREMFDIVERSHEFKELGVKILAESGLGKIALFEDKWETYYSFDCSYKECLHDTRVKYLSENMKIPKFLRVNNVASFVESYEMLRNAYPKDRVCFKYSRGEGATSFRVIDDKLTDISSLSTGKGMKITFTEAVKMFSSVQHFDDLLMLPYMEGPEVSIDCIPFKDTYIAVPRLKTGRVTSIIPDEKFVKLAQNFAGYCKMTAPFNLQLRKFKGEYNLLEVNTRLSGGSHIVASLPFNKKLSMLGYSLLNLLNVDFDVDDKVYDYFVKGVQKDLCSDIKVTQIETPVVLTFE